MPKFCPFMSEDLASSKAKNALCIKSCALYYKDHCSINIIAQAQYHEDTEKAEPVKKSTQQ